jgi:prepilin-type N-terminal cleavage/methylation domain-containing protein
MMRPGSSEGLRGERGFTLIELLVAISLGIIITLAAFSLLDFTTRDVSRITSRAQVDQTGRVALEKLMLQLHSACVARTINPIQPKSSSTVLRFISESSPLNANKEPVSSLSSVRLREITYTPASGKTEGTITEKSWPSTGISPEYKFNEKEAPTERKLLTGVSQTEVSKESLPIFRYYRYYKEGDAGVKLGQLNPTAVAVPLKEEKESELIAQVTVSFTLTPEGQESAFAKGDRAVALEDSAVLRLSPSSEASNNPNYPCSQT